MATLSTLPLTDLTLWNAPITDTGVARLAACTSLRELDLLGLGGLKLRRLQLDGTAAARHLDELRPLFRRCKFS